MLDNSSARNGGRLVALALAEWTREDGLSWHSIDEIADRTKLDPASVRRGIKELVEAGELVVWKVRFGRSYSNLYWMTHCDLDKAGARVHEKELSDKLKAAILEFVQSRKSHGSQESPTAQFVDSVVQDARLKSDPSKEVDLEPKRTCKGEPIGSLEDKPPKAKHVDGHNLPFDALIEVCDSQTGRIGGALNGDKRVSFEKDAALRVGIRALAWRELLAEAAAKGAKERAMAKAREHPEAFERRLTDMVRERAAMYRECMDGAELTPQALCRWWSDLPGKVERHRLRHAGVTSRDPVYAGLSKPDMNDGYDANAVADRLDQIVREAEEQERLRRDG